MPSVITVDIEESFLYLIVMSDGVYKSIEAAVDEAQTIGANQVLANMVHASAQTPGVEFSSIAQSTLDQVAHLHEEAFQRSAHQDIRSPKATACHKRDNMTLVVYTFIGPHQPEVCPCAYDRCVYLGTCSIACTCNYTELYSIFIM